MVFDLDICVNLILYIFSHLLLLLFYVKKLFKLQSLKGERAKKGLLQKLVRLGKDGAKMYSRCMMPKPKAYYSKKYKKFHGIVAQKLSCNEKKSMKNGS